MFMHLEIYTVWWLTDRLVLSVPRYEARIKLRIEN